MNWSVRITLLAALALMLHPGPMTCVCMGNVSLVLLWLVVLGWRDFRRERSTLAGVWLGLATAFKLYPGLLLMSLAVRRAWKSLAIAVAVVVACWTCRGAGGWLRWCEALHAITRPGEREDVREPRVQPFGVPESAHSDVRFAQSVFAAGWTALK